MHIYIYIYIYIYILRIILEHSWINLWSSQIIEIPRLCGQFPEWTCARLTLPRGQIPDWHLPDRHLADGHLPDLITSRQETASTKATPIGHFPSRIFPGQDISPTICFNKMFYFKSFWNLFLFVPTSVY